MFKLFRALFARIKAMFAADAALEIQAEIAIRGAERRASLYRLAAQYDEEGLASVAHDLRRQAEALDLRASVNDVVPAIDDIANDDPLPTAAVSPAHRSAPALTAESRSKPLKSLPHGRRRQG